MKTIPSKEAAATVPAIVEDAIRGYCTTITRYGRAKAVVVPVEFYSLAVAALVAHAGGSEDPSSDPSAATPAIAAEDQA